MDNLKNHPLYQNHTIDTAISSLFDFYKNNFAKLFAMSLIMAAVLQYAITSVFDIASLQNETDITVLMEKMGEMMTPILILALVNILFSIIIQHYILVNPLHEDSSILNSILGSFRYFFPYLIAIILFSIIGGIAIALGLVAFIIGAIFAIIYVITLILFILPIMIIEGPNISHVIGRTFKMAHKNFWTNYAWVIVFVTLFLLISFIISGLILAPFAGNFLSSIFSSDGAANFTEITQKPMYIILSVIASAITMPLMPLFSTILYLNCRAKEEPDENEEKKITVEDLYAKPYSENYSDNM